MAVKCDANVLILVSDSGSLAYTGSVVSLFRSRRLSPWRCFGMDEKRFASDIQASATKENPTNLQASGTNLEIFSPGEPAPVLGLPDSEIVRLDDFRPDAPTVLWLEGTSFTAARPLNAYGSHVHCAPAPFHDLQLHCTHTETEL